jgi:tetratricopeptide (TPR) repeat protein
MTKRVLPFLPSSRSLLIPLAVAAVALAMFGCATTGSQPRSAYDQSMEDMSGDPKAKTLYAMSRMLLAQGKEDQGEIVLRRIIQRHPDFTPAYSDLARLLVQDGDSYDAMRILRAAQDLQPQDPVILNNLGVCALVQKDYDAALAYFEAAADYNPREKRYQANKALALGLTGHSDEAYSTYRQVLTDSATQRNLELIAGITGDVDIEAYITPGEVRVERLQSNEAEEVAIEGASEEPEEVIAETASLPLSNHDAPWTLLQSVDEDLAGLER